MELFSPDVLPWFLYFFVPGFISIKVYGLLAGGYLIPKAWDHFFRNRRKACWVLVHLKGGGLVGGVFSKNSFASSYPDPEDLYLEEVWQVSGQPRSLRCA